MRLISYFVLLLMGVVLTSYQRKPAEANVQRWIQSLTRESKKTIVDTDFSNILLDRRVPYVGYIGANYQKLSIPFRECIERAPTDIVSVVLPLSRTTVVTSVGLSTSLIIGGLSILRMV